MILLYHLFRCLFLGGIRIASFRNKKAEKWIQGRKNWSAKLIKDWRPTPSDKVIWMHCASVGEFEQGRPLLESFKKIYPNTRLLLTFFSPSGYELHKNYSGVDKVVYLPFDSKKNAAAFIELIQPSLAIFVKYEFWYFYLTTLKKQQIPTLLVSGLFRLNQPFFKWWGSFHRKMLDCFTFFFLQNTASVKLIESIGYHNKCMISGDTRFDRVAAIAAVPTSLPLVESFCSENTLIAGSTWPEDEALLQEWFNLQKNWKLILVPHEIDPVHLSALKKKFPSSQLYSDLSGEKILSETNVLIIDTMGILSQIYRYGTLCYIGGGLKKSGHHNILEAAVYSKPVVTGPYIHKFSESVTLNQMGGSFVVTKGEELWQISRNQKRMEDAGKKAGEYVTMQLGATKKIMDWIQANLLLTKA
ncbi:MAG: 3-deoxy-D-manno-octulosonic acid transferase [Bacteroidetes bacterium]|nr:3-deoxy-D-manno-octulosonic acid transferase [Bacteroidota bacterium]